jgi:uncharacterized protein (TIGR00255 family)
MLRSMTGFGAASAEAEGVVVRVELRSVNHRHLQVKARLPLDKGHLESDVEARIKQHAERGAVTVSVELQRAGGARRVGIDLDVARAWQVELKRAALHLEVEDDVTMAQLLELPGVQASAQVDESSREAEDALVLDAVSRASAELVRMRTQEGAALRADLELHARGMAELRVRIAERMPEAVRGLQVSLTERVGKLLAGEVVPKGARAPVAEADLAREIALIADKMDVSEELARLGSHLAQLSSFLDAKEPVGRKLDFLVQEFLREVNTIGSKCSDAAVAHMVVELKTLIERLREQVQNVE